MAGEEEQNDRERRLMLSHAKRELFERRLDEVLKGLSTAQRVPRRKGSGPAPLSFAQQRLWFLDRLQPGTATYNIPCLIRMSGPLDVALVERVLGEIVRRHESLRTRFVMAGQEVVQEILPPLPVSLPVVDLGKIPPDRREEEAARRSREEARRPFDLGTGPLFRATLLRMAERDHMLLLSMHHSISDGWSVIVLYKEFSTLFKAFSSDAKSPLPDLPIQYADYAEWQRTSFTGDTFERQRDYWKQKLSGELPALTLATDRPRPAVQTYNGGNRTFVIPKKVPEALHALGRREAATLFMVLAAAFDVLLHRYTGLTDIVFGTPIAGRTRVELEPLIGFFVNTIVFRSDLSGDPTFPELLSRVRNTALEMFSNQDFPFDKIVEELRPDRDLSHNAMFQVMFAVQSDASTSLDLPGLQTEVLELDTDTAKFDMTISITDMAKGLQIYWEYNADLYTPVTIERMSNQFWLLLEEIAANPARRIGEFPLLSSQERERILVGWNDTSRPYPQNQSVPEAFAEQAKLTPDAIAVQCGGAQLTYRELNSRADAVARHLLAAGVGSGNVVGIAMERSLEMIVGLLGIVKCGAAYLPLDADLPAERLQAMAADCGVGILLVQEELRGLIPGFRGREIVPGAIVAGVDGDEGAMPAPPRPDDLLYIIYTSGSTGRPKGVEIPHRGVLRLVKNADYAELGTQEVMLQFAPLSFDASTFEIWGCLLNGGKLVVYDGKKASIAELGALIAREGITTLWLTEALFEQVVDEALDDLKGVRRLLTGGDVLSVPHVRKFLSRYPQNTLVNGYGPTENTTFTCCYPMRGEEDFTLSVPIGRPIANTEAYVLDERMEPVPVGVPGELYIGGAGLAHGYHLRPDLTAERFVPNPFKGSGARLYRSGDLVRYLDDGRIEFLGRRDHQVKLRGYRIELGEVEWAMRNCDGVREAVAVVREDRPGDKRLVGYCVGGTGSADEPKAIRADLRRKLPEYMVPSRIIMLDRLPMTPSGKVDRRRLPEPAVEAEGEKGGRPRTPIEEAVAKVWCEVLGMERVGVEENFFELGGHSLLATRVLSRLQEGTGVEIPLVRFFESPTVAGIAMFIEERFLDDVERLTDEQARAVSSTHDKDKKE